MSLEAVGWALSLPLEQPFKSVLFVLAYHANREGQAWPSRTRIAAEASVDIRTVARAIRRLEAQRLIEVEHRSGRGLVNRYSVNPAPGAPLNPLKGDSGTPLSRAEKVTPSTKRVTPSAKKGDSLPPKPKRTYKNLHWGPRTTNSRPPRRPKNPTPVPEQFVVTEDMTLWAETLGVPRRDIRSETDQFLDRHRAKGTQFKDWPAAWRTWMRNAVKFRAERQATPPKDDGPWKPGVYSG